MRLVFRSRGPAAHMPKLRTLLRDKLGPTLNLDPFACQMLQHVKETVDNQSQNVLNQQRNGRYIAGRPRISVISRAV